MILFKYEVYRKIKYILKIITKFKIDSEKMNTQFIKYNFNIYIYIINIIGTIII